MASKQNDPTRGGVGPGCDDRFAADRFPGTSNTSLTASLFRRTERDVSPAPDAIMRPLRPHQIRALDALRRSIGIGRLAPMLEAPTGFGKTRVMAEIVKRALAKGNRILIVVPVLALVEQTLEALEAEGIADIGVMQGIHERTDNSAPVQVASAQTLQRRKMPACDLVLIDEAHRWFAFFGTMMAQAKAERVRVIGLSATPWTKGLGKHFDDLLQAARTEDLIEAGFLSPFRVFAPSHPDLAGVRTVAGDYVEAELAEAMNKPDLVADVVSTWLRHGAGRPTLCFGVDRAHAKALQAEFESAGVRAGYIDAHTSRLERAVVFREFRSGVTNIICNVGCLTTGVDLDVRCIVLARPTQSEMLFVQIIGRGLRTAEGKTDCLILDHSDTHLNLGLVTDIHHDRLDGGSNAPAIQRQKKPLPRECPKCHFVRPAKIATCPECGFKPERQCNVEVAEGELVAFDRAAPLMPIARKASVFGQLRWIAQVRGYSHGWAAHKYREFFGVWPKGIDNAAPIEPERDIVSWVKSRQIAFAKSKERRSAHVA